MKNKTEKEKNDVIKFLEKNGFKLEDNTALYPIYSNNKCRIVIYNNIYTVMDNKYVLLESIDLNAYWLIGVLTYHGYMDKNYKQ